MELIHRRVGELVGEVPARSRVFEQFGIDYCCGGKRTLEEAIMKRGLEPAEVLAELERLGVPAELVDPSTMTMTELADHIEATHHVFLRAELPRLERLVDKVTLAHGKSYPWLAELGASFADLTAELYPHMMKEEQILFPMIRELDRGAAAAAHCGTVMNPIRVMEHEHDQAGEALRRMRELSGGFQPPANACNSFRALLDGLMALEQDMHQHIHKENNVLFVRAEQAEQTVSAASP